MNANLEAARLLVNNLSRKDRVALLSELVPSNAAPTAPSGPRVYSVARTCATFDKSKRLVMKLAAEGLLVRVTLPGRKRAVGFTAESVERLLTAGGAGL